MKKNLLSALVLLSPLFITNNAEAKLKTMNIEYKDGSQVLQGYLAYDDSIKAKKAGVLVVHEWMGLDNYAKTRTEQLAKMGYVAFAADIYGKGVIVKTPDEAGKMAGKYKSDRNLLRSRVIAGFNTLKNNKLVNQNKIAAIGYCFGGTTVLELARSGQKLNGVVSFHGGLDSPKPEDGKNIKTKVLALHGADDPFVPQKDVEAFQNEMRLGKVDWRMVIYGDAVHGFTNPKNGNDNSKGAAYNKNADLRSFKEMQEFFAEIF
ncbi:MAG: dienelactone hydrolase family protein [Candidatus Sericytochromatia bacterium]